MSDTCVVCMEELHTSPYVEHPACGEHKLHIVCAMMLSQYDIRCPMCRQSHPEMQQRVTETIIIMPDAHRRARQLFGTLLQIPQRHDGVPVDDASGNTPVYETLQSSEVNLRFRVTDRSSENGSDSDETQERQYSSQVRRQIQSYRAHRSRLIRRSEHLRQLRTQLRECNKHVSALKNELGISFRKKQRELWTTDTQIREAKRLYSNARRKHARLSSRLRTEVEGQIGLEPTPVSFE